MDLIRLLNDLGSSLVSNLGPLSLELALWTAVVLLILTVLRVHSPTLRHLAWVLVLLKPLTTLLLQSPVSLYAQLPFLADAPLQSSVIRSLDGREIAIELPSPEPMPTAGVLLTGDGVIALFWLAVTAVLLLRLIAGQVFLMFLRHWITPMTTGPLYQLLQEAAAHLKVRRSVQLALVDKGGPLVAGIFRPLVILPRHLAESLSPDQLRLIFAHELAHVRRLDNLVLLGQQLVEAVFFFHPVTWLCRRALRLEAEKACDDAVLRRFPQPARYADSLARVAELCSNHSAGRLLNTLAATESRLGWRIARILEVAPMSRSRVVTIAAAAVLSLAGCLGLPGFMHDPVQQLSRAKTQSAQGESVVLPHPWWGKTQLIQNAPNPFSDWTEINYTILEQQAVPVKLEILTAQGELVFVLDNRMLKSSKVYVRWDGQGQDGKKVPPGIYTCRLTAGDFTQAREMMLVRPGDMQIRGAYHRRFS